MMRNRIIILVMVSCLAAGCQNRTLYRDTRVMMGTFIEVSSPSPKASGIVFAEIARIERLLSKYNASSEIARLNSAGQVHASPETMSLISKAIYFYEKTNGAFDITVAPLVDLWGFTDKDFRVPTREDIKKTLALVGSDKIILNNKDNMIKFMLSGMKIDLGAIAKGYALDCAREKLKAHGIRDCLINAGGQVYGLGANAGRPWRIAIQDPRQDTAAGLIEIQDRSVATSGDYEQYFTAGGKRYSHIIDPKTGYPAQSGITAVTVIAPSGTTADALSTAIFVLGKDDGVRVAEAFPGVQVKIYE